MKPAFYQWEQIGEVDGWREVSSASPHFQPLPEQQQQLEAVPSDTQHELAAQRTPCPSQQFINANNARNLAAHQAAWWSVIQCCRKIESERSIH
jgi:hypothetical protein